MSARRLSKRSISTTSVSLPSPEELQRIIQQGDTYLAVKYAQDLGERLATQLTSSQIRNVFTTARQIEMNWPVRAEGNEVQRAVRQLVLLKPKLAYQASRAQKGTFGMRVLRDLLAPAIDLVGEDRDRFQNFMDFFEAILAYHTAAGGQ